MVNHGRQQFSWDPIKNQTNITKHGISFFKAAKIFDGPRLEREDTRRDYGETRIIALGRSERKILRIVYTRRNSVIRIITQERQTNVKEQNTHVTYTRSELDALPDETDWERVDALTDEDIEKAALSDPDDPPTDASFWKDATVVMPENSVKEDNFDNTWAEKLRMAEAFLESATVLSVPLKRVERGDSDEQLAEKREVCHFLYAVVFELAIKIIWEVENQKECERHHRILDFYTELSPERQSHIRQLYEKQLNLVRREIYTDRAGRRGYVDDLVEFQSLEDALKANYDTVTNFKYERRFHGKSSVIAGIIWQDDGYWIFPNKYIVFPKEIMKYVTECVESHP